MALATSLSRVLDLSASCTAWSGMALSLLRVCPVPREWLSNISDDRRDGRGVLGSWAELFVSVRDSLDISLSL